MRIILCDDHDLVVLSLTKLFEQHGHEVVASSGVVYTSMSLRISRLDWS